MKYVKMLGLAALAAFALMAVAGASTAAAKVCSGSGTGAACEGSHGKVYTGTFEATATNATLTSGFAEVNCSHSVVKGNITNGEAGTGEITSLTFTGCTSPQLGACTAGTSGHPWPASVASSSGTNGTMTVNNVAGSFTCAGTTCNYGAATATGITVAGGSPAVVTAKAVALTKQAGSGFLCSSTAQWHGTYTVLSPTSLYIT